jgi:penicillin-binding protein 1C
MGIDRFNPFTRFALAGALVLTLLCGYSLRPIGPAALAQPVRTIAFSDRNGLPLGTISGDGDRETSPVPLERIAPVMLQALVAAEDRRFFSHGAVDWLAALRAFGEAARTGRMPHGASTISMQLARLIEPLPGGAYGKLVEAVRAQRIENGCSKRTILEAYANRVPMGSNLAGVEAAAHAYFGSDAAHLDLAQAALLAALPNDPTALDPYRHRAALEVRRRAILARLYADGAISAESFARARGEEVAVVPRARGFVAAPHLLFALARTLPAGETRVATTLDLALQRFVEGQVRAVVAALGERHATAAAALVVENHTGDVLAYVGSPDYFSDAALGGNDGVQALRQPGSTLKPFVYELALERRVVAPTAILADVPATYAIPGARIYAPSDYSGRFSGPVRLRGALANSLNVPAVRVLESVGVDAFLERLRALGFAHLDRPPSHYGLGLALGSGEVTLAELARAYATLARGGDAVALRTTLDDAGADHAAAVADAGAAHGDGQAAPAAGAAWALVRDFLADRHARAQAFGVNSVLALPFPAFAKTGTSSDFRDTWTVGGSTRYTVAVWVGNFDGSPMRHVSGVTGAGPLWNRIMLHVHERAEPAPFDPPFGYRREAICATTGFAPDARCTSVVMEYVAPGTSLTPAPRRASSPEDRLDDAYAPWLAHQPERARGRGRILFPRDGDRFALFPGGDQRLVFDFAGAAAPRAVRIDGRRLAPTDGRFVWGLAFGMHTLEASFPEHTARVRFSVGGPPSAGRRGFALEPAS